MLSLKIHGATPKSGKGLCHTCKNARIVRGQNCEELIFCSGPFSGVRNVGIVPFRVSECGAYHPSNMPWLHEMEDMAWKIEARKRGPVGFEPENSEMEVVINPPNKPSSNQGPSSVG